MQVTCHLHVVLCLFSHAYCSIVLEENPLADFVELPEHLQDLRSCV